MGSLALSLCMSAVGCQGFVDVVENKARATASAAANVAMSQDTRRSKKLDGPLHCVNFTAPIVSQAKAHYHGWADAEHGPSSMSTAVGGVFSIADDPTCLQGLEISQQTEPADLELDAASSEFAAAYLAVQVVSATAHDYYAKRSYEDDEFGGALDLHPELEAAFARFAVAEAVLRGVVETRTTDRLRAELEELEAGQGQTLPFQVKRTVATARGLAIAATAEPIDRAALSAAVDALGQARSSAIAYVDQHPQHARRVENLDAFLEQAAIVEAEALELVNRHDEGRAFSKVEQMHIDHGTPALVAGTPARVQNAYRELVRSNAALSWHT